MIYAIGHDIVALKRIEKLWACYGMRFSQRILSDSEHIVLLKCCKPEQFLAKRFAAKEAFAKACGTGFRAPILPTAITISNDALGKPQIILTQAITNWLQQQGVAAWHLSITDDKNLASAFVVLERRQHHCTN